ncbi:hypothetical protein GE061_011829 [Apolygus lucorum]|uniref:Activator 1 large subunit n=1 Tax=Apolygus lucorum TaxID=248454 RepID=A0A8S9Y0P3_APOLU|nr:hypothetical protein GE061_011829 [Apolygus lucorum]
MQDIRSFFRTSAEKGKSSFKQANDKKSSRKRVLIESDSDEEPIKTPKRKSSQKSIKSSTKKAKEEESSTSKYFEVDKNKVKSLFGTEPVKQVKAPPKLDSKSVAENELADVSAAFLDMDDDDWVQEVSCTPPKTKVEEKLGQSSESPKKNHALSPTSSPKKRARSASVSPSKKAKSSKQPVEKTKKTAASAKIMDHDLSPEPSPVKPPPQKDSPLKKSPLDVRVKQVVPRSPLKEKEKSRPKIDSPVVATKSSNEIKNGCVTTSKPNKFCGSSQSPCTPSSSKASSSTSSPSAPKLREAKFQLWVDKYKPGNLKAIIGQQGEKSNVNKLVKWLKAWHSNQTGDKKIPKPSPWAKDDSGAFFKAALLSGPPGVGKTTTAHLVCKELDLDVVEFNASDTRSKRLLHEEITELLSSKSLTPFVQGGYATSKNHVLIMDEVDGMAGNEDRGGIQELISLIKGSKIPVICMCNDRNHPKIRSLVNHCFDLRFFKPRADQIKGAMMSICFKEGLKIKPDVLNNIITSTNQDIRLVLNHLSMLAAKRDSEMVVTSKELKLGAWDVLRKVFTENEHRGMSIHDKLDLFFHDYSIAPLFVQENYLNVVPHAADAKSKKDKMKLFAVAAASLCHGDLVERAIRSNNAWSLLPTQAVFSSLIPGETLEGHVGGMINFPEWLGKNSKKNKMDRLAQEIQSHTRLKASASNEAVRLDYARALRDSVLQPLIQNGSEGVESSLAVLKEYSLLREDIESLNELSLWTGFKDPMSSIDSKVKAAFTRAYNKNPVMTPFSISSAGVKKSRGAQDTEGLDELNEDGEEVVGEEEDEGEPDPLADGMIMVKKKTKAESSKEPKKKKKESSAGSKPRGGGRGKGIDESEESTTSEGVEEKLEIVEMLAGYLAFRMKKEYPEKAHIYGIHKKISPF